MTKIEKQYYAIINNLSTLPVKFTYDGIDYIGLNSEHFEEISRTTNTLKNKVEIVIRLRHSDTLELTLVTAVYPKHDAYEYTLHFTNPSKTENSKIISNLDAINKNLTGDNPILRGILGDHQNFYRDYERDLKSRNVYFLSSLGRATHITFPYFNFEHDDGGSLFAIGWGGTWKAQFEYDETSNTTNYTGTGTITLNTYLKPGENIRTPLMAQLDYYQRNEAHAMNKWRRWMVDCVMPRDRKDSELCAQPVRSVFLAVDTGKINSDGSVSEDYTTWKRSIDEFFNHGLIADYRVTDAGWYGDPYNKEVVFDWWGTVGTWKEDPYKWPGNTYRDSVDYIRAKGNGTGTYTWFEPERVTHLDAMVSNHNYDRSWALPDDRHQNHYLNNLGNSDCLDWTTERILDFMERNNQDMYREDFNIDPSYAWSRADALQGDNRNGITENLYMQGHYQLWDNILQWLGNNNKHTYLDSCASGGGRNDLETLKRAVPFLRSDYDGSTIPRRLFMTTRLSFWVPFNGSNTHDGNPFIGSKFDLFAMRASTHSVLVNGARFYHERDTLNWEEMKRGQEEHIRISPYLHKDMYMLTPRREIDDFTNWTAIEYFDYENGSAVVQAFRLDKCLEKSIILQVKGLDPNKYYNIICLDNINSAQNVKGSQIMMGLPIYSQHPRQAFTIYIIPVEN